MTIICRISLFIDFNDVLFTAVSVDFHNKKGWLHYIAYINRFFRSSGSSSSCQYSRRSAAPLYLSVIYHACQSWWLVDVCVRRPRRRSSSRRHVFSQPVTALSPWLRRGHGTTYRHLSQRYLRWRPLGISWRRNCLSEALLLSTALPTTASDRYSVHTFASHSRFVTVFSFCKVSLQSFSITPPKSFLSIIIIIIINMLCRAGKTLAGYSIMLRSTTWSIVLSLELKYHHPRSH